MAQKHHRLTVTVEDYDDSKVQQACLLTPKEVAVTGDVLKRCGLTAEVEEVEGPFFSLTAGRGGSTIETSLRTLDELAKLLPEFSPSALADLKAGKPDLHLENSRNGVPVEVDIARENPNAGLPEVPSMPEIGLLPGTKDAKLGLSREAR